MAAPYIGNNDYRGYLNYLSQNSSNPSIKNPASTLLKLVGNDANFPSSYWNGSDLSNTNQQFYQQYLGLQGGGAGQVIQPGATYSAPKPVYAPKLDIAGLQANARNQATSDANVFYTKVLNDYLARQATEKALAEQQNQLTNSAAEQELKNTLDTNTVAGNRATEDAATNAAQIAQTEDQFQTDSGQAFDKARIEEARRAAVAGTTGGTAAASQQNLQTSNATAEQRQEQQFQQQRDQSELFKNRKFEDIALQNSQATGSKETKVKQSNFDLDKFIKQQALDEIDQRNALNEKRKQDIAESSKAYEAKAFSDYLNRITNPAQLSAAISTYGGLF